MKTLKMSLCACRHDIPDAVDGSVFATIDPAVMTDTKRLERKAFSGIWSAAFRRYQAGESGYLVPDPCWDGSDMEPLQFVSGLHVDLYVTGLSVALVAVINVCTEEGIGLTLWHFDRATGSYFPQVVKTRS